MSIQIWSDINLFPEFAIYTHIWKWYHVASDLKRFSLLAFMYLDLAAYLYEFGNCNVLFCLRFHLILRAGSNLSCPHFFNVYSDLGVIYLYPFVLVLNLFFFCFTQNLDPPLSQRDTLSIIANSWGVFTYRACEVRFVN